MFRISWKYITFLVVLVLLYFVLLFFMPQRFDWFVTFHKNDKNPFGAYVFNELVSNSWITEFNSSNKSLFELKETEEQNLLIICDQFETSPSEIESMISIVEDGKTIIIAAHQMDSSFMNALDIEINMLSFSFILDNMWGEDTLGLNISDEHEKESTTYWYPSQLLAQHFIKYDTATTKVLSRNTNEDPVLLQTQIGSGTFLLSSTPLAFSNYSMMHANNYEYVAQLLENVGHGGLHWTEYYQLGRMESGTPLRYILTQPPLKWALYILMVSILIFMIFELKRKQRVIPVMVPPKNETMDFVKTISRLYFQKKDHKNLAAKKILHFTEYLKHQLHIDPNDEIDHLIAVVAAKTNSEQKSVAELFDQMGRIGNATFISSKELRTLTGKIDKILKN